jgi:hypothetical protein
MDYSLLGQSPRACFRQRVLRVLFRRSNTKPPFSHAGSASAFCASCVQATHEGGPSSSHAMAQHLLPMD